MRETWMRAKLYGHRGAKCERPENTIKGFAYAASLGLAGVETDIALTADLVPVLHHDPALDDGRLIRDINFASLPGHVPALADAIRAVPDIAWLLEIKTYPDRPGLTHSVSLMVDKTLAAIAGLDLARFTLLAFDWAVLRAAAAQTPALRRVCLTAPETEAERGLWWGPGFGGMAVPQAVAASGAYGWAGLHNAMAEAHIAQARALGLKTFAWTVNEQADFDRLEPLVDGLITDHPGRFCPS